MEVIGQQPKQLHTEEEEKLISEIDPLLKASQFDKALPLIENILTITKNKQLYGEYARLKKRIQGKLTPKKAEKKGRSELTLDIEYPKTKFANIIGMNETKKKLQNEIRLITNNHEDIKKHSLKTSGFLLYGAPGTGKSFFIEALAGEYNLPLLRPELGDILNSWVGETEKNIQQLVREAVQAVEKSEKKVGPAIIFLDEVDRLIKNRAASQSGEGESEVARNATTQFLTTMQAIHNNENRIIFAGATNMILDVDAAAKRPGRLGNLIYIRPPNFAERIKFFAYYLKSMNPKLNPFQYLRLSIATSSYSSADIEEICQEAKKNLLLEGRTNGPIYAKDVIRVIKKEFRQSSIDTWYINEYKRLILQIVETTRKVKFLLFFTKDVHEKVETKGNITDDEKKLYKEMIKDIRKKVEHMGRIRMLRWMGRWL